jgi:hypothetical protein
MWIEADSSVIAANSAPLRNDHSGCDPVASAGPSARPFKPAHRSFGGLGGKGCLQYFDYEPVQALALEVRSTPVLV